MCHSLGVALSSPPTQTKMDVKDVNSEIVTKRRVEIFQNFFSSNFRSKLDYFSCKIGQSDQNGEQRTHNRIDETKSSRRKIRENEASYCDDQTR